MMYVALSYDHRIIDGREAVTFLVRVEECIEDPERILGCLVRGEDMSDPTRPYRDRGRARRLRRGDTCRPAWPKTACIDKRGNWGGTCLNVGCIPSKAPHSSEKFEEAQDHLAEHGVKVGKVELDLETLMARKDKVVDDLTRVSGFCSRRIRSRASPARRKSPSPARSR